MIDEYVRTVVLKERLRNHGLLAPHIDDFTDWQRGQGFKPLTIECDLRSLAGWADWLKAREYGIVNIVEGFEACKSDLKANGRIFYSRGPNKYSIKAAAKYIRFLREQGVVPKLPAKPTPSEVWPLLHEFRSWARQHRGTRDTTLDLYETTLRDLMKIVGDQPQTYTAKTIRDFILS